MLEIDVVDAEVPIKEPSFEIDTTFESSYILHRVKKTPTRAKSIPYRILKQNEDAYIFFMVCSNRFFLEQYFF